MEAWQTIEWISENTIGYFAWLMVECRKKVNTTDIPYEDLTKANEAALVHGDRHETGSSCSVEQN